MAAIPLDEEINPYAPPRAVESREGSTDVDDPLSAAVRRDHLHREAAVQALGLSCYLWGFFMAVGGIVFFVIGNSVAYVYFALVWLAVALGRGLRRLMPRARRAFIVVLTLLLLGCLFILVAAVRQDARLVGVGCALCTIPYGSALGLLLSPSTAQVFTPDYREAVSRSPSLKPRLGFGGMVATGASISLLVVGIVLLFIDAIRDELIV